MLSPARSDGARAKLLLDSRARFPLAMQLREPEGAELGDVFSFLSGLYFRGKLAYARTFATATRRHPPTLIITADRGLVPPEARVRREDLERFSRVDISGSDERYLDPLRRAVEQLDDAMPASGHVVLLGSIATAKYVDPLMTIFGERLLFPIDFVGRGDMSRGGLLLRCAREGRELEYSPVAGAVRRGRRPARLERPTRARQSPERKRTE